MEHATSTDPRWRTYRLMGIALSVAAVGCIAVGTTMSLAPALVGGLLLLMIGGSVYSAGRFGPL